MFHRAVQPADDGAPCVFRWHWPRRTFDRRMSAKELLPFVLPHMPAILPLLSGRARDEWHALLIRLCRPDVDEVFDWIKVVPDCEEDQILELNLNPRTPATPGPSYFVMR